MLVFEKMYQIDIVKKKKKQFIVPRLLPPHNIFGTQKNIENDDHKLEFRDNKKQTDGISLKKKMKFYRFLLFSN